MSPYRGDRARRGLFCCFKPLPRAEEGHLSGQNHPNVKAQFSQGVHGQNHLHGKESPSFRSIYPFRWHLLKAQQNPEMRVFQTRVSWNSTKTDNVQNLSAEGPSEKQVHTGTV